jgi:hypothetical protein
MSTGGSNVASSARAACISLGSRACMDVFSLMVKVLAGIDSFAV